MEFKAEKGVPLPPKVPRTGFTAMLRALEVGESRLLPTDPQKANTLAYKIFGRGNYRSHREEGGTRIWRTA